MADTDTEDAVRRRYATAPSYTLQDLLTTRPWINDLPRMLNGVRGLRGIPKDKFTLELERPAVAFVNLNLRVTQLLPRLTTLTITSSFHGHDPEDARSQASAEEIIRQDDFLQVFERAVPVMFRTVALDYCTMAVHLPRMVRFLQARATTTLEVCISVEDMPTNDALILFFSWLEHADCKLQDLRLKFRDYTHINELFYIIENYRGTSPNLQHVQLEQEGNWDMQLGDLPNLEMFSRLSLFQGARKYSFLGFNLDDNSCNAFVRFLKAFIVDKCAVRLSNVWYERELDPDLFIQPDPIDGADKVQKLMKEEACCKVLSLKSGHMNANTHVLFPWGDPGQLKPLKDFLEFDTAMSELRPFLRMTNKEWVHETDQHDKAWKINEVIRDLRMDYIRSASSIDFAKHRASAADWESCKPPQKPPQKKQKTDDN